jgi:hypothetical protein
VDFNSRVREGMPGRVLLSPVNSSKLMLDKRYIIPKTIESTDDHICVTEIGSEGKTGNFFILYQGARTNGHSVIAPSNDLLDNIAFVRTKQKVAIKTFNIQYS